MELIQNTYEQYTLLSQSEQMREVSAEVIVPDTQADVFSVLTTFGICQIRRKTARADWLTVEGSVEVTALCQEEEPGEWQCVRGSIPFTQEIEIPGCQEDSTVFLQTEVLRSDALIRNPRKLQLGAQLGFRVQAFRKTPFSVTESAGGSEEEDIQLLSETEERELLWAATEKKLTASDELPPEDAGTLLYYTVEWMQEEQRVLSGKVMLRGDILLNAVFFDGEDLQKREYRIPFSQVAECEGLEPGDGVRVGYQTLQSKVSAEEGEHPLLSCSFTGLAFITAMRSMKLPVLRDLYSTRYESECRRGPLACPAWRAIHRSIPTEETVQPAENAVRVLDCRVCGRGFADEEGKMGGVYVFRLLYSCAAGQLHCEEHTVRILDRESTGLSALSVCAGASGLSAKAENGAIRLVFTAELEGRGVTEQPCEQVIACTLDREKRRSLPPAGTLVLRTVQPGETVWSIARQYGSRTEQIRSANKLESGSDLQPGLLMLIPFCG